MTDELKQQFTRRITNANKSELIVILCDMFDIYVSDAKTAIENGNQAVFKNNIRYARAVLSELIDSLNLEYELARNIYQLYRFVERYLIKADIKLDKTYLIPCLNIMRKMNESYEKIAKIDPSGPVMKNTEEVYAGMTYGRTDLNENMNTAYNRGFWA